MLQSRTFVRIVFFIFLLFAVEFYQAKIVFGQQESNVIIENGNNCENNKARFDYISFLSEEAEIFPIIIISRLGTGEASRKYNRRRLYEIAAYLERTGTPKEKIITAQGDKVNGRGRVEVYYGWGYKMIFTMGRNQNLQGRECGEG